MSFFTFIPTRFQWRQDIAANWAANNPTPLQGEPCLETDTWKWKIGDGVTEYNLLPYAVGDIPSTAADLDYDNTASGLTATDVQAAIDEVAAASGSGGSGGTDDFKFNSVANYSIYGDAPGTWTVSTVADVIIAAGGVAQSILVRNDVLFSDGIASCDISQAEDAGLVLRAVYGNDYYVATIKDALAGNEVRIFKRVAGTFTQLGSTATIAFTRNTQHTFSFEANGTSLVAKFDGVTAVSVTDSSITAAGKVGLRAGSGSANQFDSFTWP
jgi:hypothetical protein